MSILYLALIVLVVLGSLSWSIPKVSIVNENNIGSPKMLKKIVALSIVYLAVMQQ